MKKVLKSFIILISIIWVTGSTKVSAKISVKLFNNLFNKSYKQLKEYLKNPKSYIAIVWPISPLESDPQIEAMLNKYGKILYKEAFVLNRTEVYILLRLAHPHILNTAEHVNWYFPPGTLGKPTRVYIVLFDNLNTAVDTKHKIRRLFNLQYRTIHINDTRAETKELGKFFFKR